MVRYLLVVARNQPTLGHYLKESLAGDENVQVLSDRRWGPRRQRIRPCQPERRRSERRSRPSLDNDLRYRSFAIIRQRQPAASNGGRPMNGDGVHGPPIDHSEPGPAVEIIRHSEGPIEVKLSGLVKGTERRVRRWRMATLVLLVGLVVGASFAVAALALRWDYQRGRTVQLLHMDLETAQARARCWEAVPRHWPKSPEDVIRDAKRTDWVRRCVSTELARLNSKH